MLDEAAVEEFKVTLRGELVRPGDQDYDDLLLPPGRDPLVFGHG